MPVLTIPTALHGEQLMNARMHARQLPNLVRIGSGPGNVELTVEDLRWLSGFDLSGRTKQFVAARNESLRLRARCEAVATDGIDKLLEVANSWTGMPSMSLSEKDKQHATTSCSYTCGC